MNVDATPEEMEAVRATLEVAPGVDVVSGYRWAIEAPCSTA